MINNVNPNTSKLLDQIKRLSIHTTKKDEDHTDFKLDVVNNRTHTTKELKRTNLINSIERIQKKSDIPIEPLENNKMKVIANNVQTSELAKIVDMQKKHRREPVGALLDVYF
ncbi:hypothetical protein B188_01550 [Candidatus Brocadiaceae bacterium B188]|nr:hypothetical protein [Candidatus Brocadia sapporoensis]QQR67409.1 MAG: hypothetical protein IPI25_04090 [Candidatus Brocadia sp.]RZV56324.1 MAG: hypothetical protein EX330_13780 [Candidatus Brocadia sp. BROELEC01]TWU52208.1 hypothetical protein B188_01550 [Candidatus Brocadiaceae bacterium B188]